MDLPPANRGRSGAHFAAVFTAAITVAAFVPLFTMQGVEGQIFNPMARTYGFALAGALIATFTITPVLASLLLPEHIAETETIVVRALRAAYSPALHWSLTHRKTMVGIGVGFLAFTALLAPRLGTEFLPALEEGNLWIRASMPPTISLEAAMPSPSVGRRPWSFAASILKRIWQSTSSARRPIPGKLSCRRSRLILCGVDRAERTDAMLGSQILNNAPARGDSSTISWPRRRK